MLYSLYTILSKVIKLCITQNHFISKICLRGGQLSRQKSNYLALPVGANVLCYHYPGKMNPKQNVTSPEAHNTPWPSSSPALVTVQVMHSPKTWPANMGLF